jgi:hypothetical protein
MKSYSQIQWVLKSTKHGRKRPFPIFILVEFSCFWFLTKRWTHILDLSYCMHSSMLSSHRKSVWMKKLCSRCFYFLSQNKIKQTIVFNFNGLTVDNKYKMLLEHVHHSFLLDWIFHYTYSIFAENYTKVMRI